MSRSMQDQIRESGEGNNANNNSDDGEGGPSFQCSVDRVEKCSADALPTAPGPMREDIGLLVRSYRTVLNNEKDCSKIASAIEA